MTDSIRLKNALPSQAMHFDGNTVTTLQVTCCKGNLFFRNSKQLNQSQSLKCSKIDLD